MAIRSIRRRVMHQISGLPRTWRASRASPASSRRVALAGLCLVASLTCADRAVAATSGKPVIRGLTFAGTNVDLAIKISGTGFGTAPDGVPCANCTTPYLLITDGRGYGCQIFNIKSWTDTRITFDGFQGNPGDTVLLLVRNPQTKRLGASANSSIPKTIGLAPPKITSVAFSGGVGPNLEMTIVGSGFGTSPLAVPFNGDLPFFSFIDKPFAANQWQAGYGLDTITLKYGLWSDNRIIIVGFGGSYGARHTKVTLNDPVEIAVATSGTCGLNVNVAYPQLGPSSIGAIWGGLLR
jgi:hypothetical protein